MLANLKERLCLLVIFFILRIRSERTEMRNPVARTYTGWAMNDHMTLESDIITKPDVITDDRIRSYFYILAYLGSF